ncbi:MAG: heme exporter protein CcmD [Geminicoccaceae bacterium]|nr:heme exporter protein CcmD [Geminicoccaceae bacterium]
MAMGGYGAYVWSAFGFAALSMGGLLWQSFRAARRSALEVERLRDTRRARPRRAPRRLEPRAADAGDFESGSRAGRPRAADEVG